MTHVLLPVVALLRRADLAAVIGAALAAKAAGAGHRGIALALGRPAETVRGWLRRFAGRLEAVRAVFTLWLRALDPDPVMPAWRVNAWADAVAAIVAVTAAVAAAVRARRCRCWEVAAAVSGGRLLAPGWPGVVDQHELTLTRGDHAVSLARVHYGASKEGWFVGVSAEDEHKNRAERAREIGLFRYLLIREAADPAHSTKERGRMVRAIAAAEHTDPFGRRSGSPADAGPVDPGLADRRVRRAGAHPAPAQPAHPGRGAGAGGRVAAGEPGPDRGRGSAGSCAAQLGWAPDERTLQRQFIRLGLTRSAASTATPAVFGRFEAERPNELWTGDALHGPTIGGRKTYLFAFLDDHSRAVVGHRWGFAEDTVRLAAALRPALAARGVPEDDLRRQRLGVRGRLAAAGLREARASS